jgi:hypothetical protein
VRAVADCGSGGQGHAGASRGDSPPASPPSTHVGGGTAGEPSARQLALAALRDVPAETEAAAAAAATARHSAVAQEATSGLSKWSENRMGCGL